MRPKTRAARFGAPPKTIENESATTVIAKNGVQKPARPARAPRPKVKNDPKFIAAARELRDRYLEQFNSGLIASGGKYQVGRLSGQRVSEPLQLPQAA